MNQQKVFTPIPGYQIFSTFDRAKTSHVNIRLGQKSPKREPERVSVPQISSPARRNSSYAQIPTRNVVSAISTRSPPRNPNQSAQFFNTLSESQRSPKKFDLPARIRNPQTLFVTSFGDEDEQKTVVPQSQSPSRMQYATQSQQQARIESGMDALLKRGFFVCPVPIFPINEKRTQQPYFDPQLQTLESIPKGKPRMMVHITKPAQSSSMSNLTRKPSNMSWLEKNIVSFDAGDTEEIPLETGPKERLFVAQGDKTQVIDDGFDIGSNIGEYQQLWMYK